MIQSSIGSHWAAVWMTRWADLALVHKLEQRVYEVTVNCIKMRTNDLLREIHQRAPLKTRVRGQ